MKLDYTSECDQMLKINVNSTKSTTSKFTASCLQDNKNETKQKAEAVAGLSFGSSASASNFNATNSAQRAEALSTFYSMSSQTTSAKMLMNASRNINDNTNMGICDLKLTLESMSVRATQSINIEASIDDKVDTNTTMKMEQFNSNTTAQTATAKTGMSLMWILILILLLVVFVLIGPVLLRMLFSASSLGVRTVGGGMRNAVVAGAGLLSKPFTSTTTIAPSPVLPSR
jgi:cobalamin biosynthesis Mg chelatase CobN